MWHQIITVAARYPGDIWGKEIPSFFLIGSDCLVVAVRWFYLIPFVGSLFRFKFRSDSRKSRQKYESWKKRRKIKERSEVGRHLNVLSPTPAWLELQPPAPAERSGPQGRSHPAAPGIEQGVGPAVTLPTPAFALAASRPGMRAMALGQDEQMLAA